MTKKSLKITKVQWPKEKVQKDKQRSTNHTHKTKYRVTRTPLCKCSYGDWLNKVWYRHFLNISSLIYCIFFISGNQEQPQFLLFLQVLQIILCSIISSIKHR